MVPIGGAKLRTWLSLITLDWNRQMNQCFCQALPKQQVQQIPRMRTLKPWHVTSTHLATWISRIDASQTCSLPAGPKGCHQSWPPFQNGSSAWLLAVPGRFMRRILCKSTFAKGACMLKWLCSKAPTSLEPTSLPPEWLTSWGHRQTQLLFSMSGILSCSARGRYHSLSLFWCFLTLSVFFSGLRFVAISAG